jgi:hypothetical protein
MRTFLNLNIRAARIVDCSYVKQKRRFFFEAPLYIDKFILFFVTVHFVLSNYFSTSIIFCIQTPFFTSTKPMIHLIISMS